METRVISRIAQELFYKTTNTPEALRRDSRSISSGRSKDASPDYINSVAVASYGDERGMKVQKLQNSIQTQHYDLDEQVIEQIAKKIVQMLA